MKDTQGIGRSIFGLALVIVIIAGSLLGFDVKIQVEDVVPPIENSVPVTEPVDTEVVEQTDVDETTNVPPETDKVTENVVPETDTSTPADSTQTEDAEPDVDNSVETEVAEPTEDETVATEGDVENA